MGEVDAQGAQHWWSAPDRCDQQNEATRHATSPDQRGDVGRAARDAERHGDDIAMVATDVNEPAEEGGRIRLG